MSETSRPRLWARTRWEPEDPIRRAARLAAIPAALVVVVIGAVTGNILVIGAGAALLRVAMAAPSRR